MHHNVLMPMNGIKYTIKSDTRTLHVTCYRTIGHV